jgi:hypothetical protein
VKYCGRGKWARGKKWVREHKLNKNNDLKPTYAVKVKYSSSAG